MKLLEEYIRTYGEVPNDDVLKVDAFLNHQIDPQLFKAIGKEITKIVTIETSGIAPCVFLGYLLHVPVVYMKKNPSKIMTDDCYHTNIHSFTKDRDYEIVISKKYISSEDNVLFIDDFMANGEACLGAIRVLKEAQATICGIGIVIEKAFQSGRKQVQALGYDVYAQARIASLKNGTIVFAE